MRRKRNQNIIFRAVFNAKTFFILALALVVYIAIPISKNISKGYVIDQEIKELEEEISDLKEGNQNFEKLIEYLESDQFAEEQARLSLGLKKKGEEVVVIDTAGQVAGASATLEDTKKQDKNNINPVKWWQYFFTIN